VPRANRKRPSFELCHRKQFRIQVKCIEQALVHQMKESHEDVLSSGGQPSRWQCLALSSWMWTSPFPCLDNPVPKRARNR
jgi:hypothetical protein